MIEKPVPPQAIEAEQSVLGALLLDNQAFERIVNVISAADFYGADHRAIFKHIVQLIENDKPADVITAAESLEKSAELQNTGGLAYLGALVQNTPTAANIRNYAEIVRDKSILRMLQAHANDVLASAAEHGADPRALAENAEAKFLSILQADNHTDPVSMAAAVGEAIDARDEPQHVLLTGLANLDRMLSGGGLKPGQLIIIAARSSMGKSALALNIAEHVATSHQVAFFTLEMTRRELAERALAYHETELGKSEAVRHLAGLKLVIDETPAVTLGHVRMRCRRIRRKHGLGLVVIDYLQLMRGTGENRTQEVGSLSRGLKAIAKELNVPVIAVAQINRGVETRQDKRPLLSDLRESGDLEADADIVAMLYRDEYYAPDTQAHGLAEVIIRKQRNGPTGTVYMRFTPELTRFHVWEGEIPRAPTRARGIANFEDFKSNAAGERG